MTTIINKPSGLNFSDSLRRVSVQTSAKYVTVTLKTGSGDMLYTNTLYPFEGVAVMYEVNNVIEAYMREHSQTLTQFSLTVSEADQTANADSCIFYILYCDNSINVKDVGSLTQSRFLTSRMSRRVPPSFTDTVSLLVPGGERLLYEVRFTVRNILTDELLTDITTSDIATSVVDTIRTLTVSSANILSVASAMTGVVSRDLQLVSFALTVGSRALSYYVDPALRRDSCFTFRNMFNVPERIYLPCSAVANTEVEQQPGVIDGTTVMYDRVLTRSYNVTTGPLTVGEARTLDSLLMSHDICKINLISGVESAYPILLTDISCEIADDPEEPSTVEFTWQYSDTRPVTLIEVPVRVFSSQFNICFS